VRLSTQGRAIRRDSCVVVLHSRVAASSTATSRAPPKCAAFQRELRASVPIDALAPTTDRYNLTNCEILVLK
jgi:hypothetical protein